MQKISKGYIFIFITVAIDKALVFMFSAVGPEKFSSMVVLK